MSPQRDNDTGESAPLLRSRSADSQRSSSVRPNLSSFQLDDDTHQLARDGDQNGSAAWLAALVIGKTPTQLQQNGGGKPNMKKPRTSVASFFSGKYQAKLALFLCYLSLIIFTFMIMLGPLYLSFQSRDTWCVFANEEEEEDNQINTSRELKSSKDNSAGMLLEENEYENPDYDMDPCYRIRLPLLLWMTLEDCDICRRMLMSVLLGGAIGYERRLADRPAGIRTMGLVSLGACFFTISSIMAFKSSTMGWDSSRVTAALPSGVGFLGGALIWKGSVFVNEGETRHQVHGLTTAASLWLSAAIGVGAGGALYAVTIYSTVLVILVLRYGPKMYFQKDDDDDDDNCDDDDDEEEEDVNEAEIHKPKPRRPARDVPTFHR